MGAAANPARNVVPCPVEPSRKERAKTGSDIPGAVERTICKGTPGSQQSKPKEGRRMIRRPSLGLSGLAGLRLHEALMHELRGEAG